MGVQIIYYFHNFQIFNNQHIALFIIKVSSPHPTPCPPPTSVVASLLCFIHILPDRVHQNTLSDTGLSSGHSLGASSMPTIHFHMELKI